MSSLKIEQEGSPATDMTFIWELFSSSNYSDDEWLIGQARVTANRLTIVAKKGDPNIGYAALDSLTFKSVEQSINNCETLPTVAKPPKTLPNCTFDDGDTCFWEVAIQTRYCKQLIRCMEQTSSGGLPRTPTSLLGGRIGPLGNTLGTSSMLR